jgi:DNA uptake protein ComE-like DNA-binding protein
MLAGDETGKGFQPGLSNSMLVQATDTSEQQVTKEIRGQNKPASYSRKSKIEINSADSSELTDLYGIGPAYASRIIKFRNLLGGFYKPGQLLEVYGMDSSRYSGFVNDIILDTLAIVKINLNTAGFRDLLRHPYLDYEEVRSIINFRDNNGPFLSPGQLWTDSILANAKRDVLYPYLSIK